MMRHINKIIVSVIAYLVIGMTSAFALDKQEVNFGEMELGKVYQLVDFSSCYGTFKAPKTGYLLVRGTYSDILKPFKEMKGTVLETVADNDNAYEFTMLKGYGALKEGDTETPYLSAWEMPVEEGKTYYLCTGSVMTESKMVLSMDDRDFIMTSTFGEADKVITPTVNGKVAFVFNRPVVYSSARLLINGNPMSLAGTASSTMCSISFDLKTVLINQLRAGLMKTGDAFTLEVDGVKSEDGMMLYNGDGKISMELKAGVLPTMILEESANFGKKFLTWYESGDEEGIFTLTFNGPLDEAVQSATNGTGAKAVLRFGDKDEQEAGGYYQETANDEGAFTMKIEGNKIILDFTGKRRTISDMVTSTESKNDDAFKYLNLEVSQVRDANGVRTYTESSTTNGKYNYKFELENPTANIESDFTPANGANIDKYEQVKIWIADYAKLKHEGIDFVYTDGDVEKTVTVTDYSSEYNVDEDGDVELTVNIPAEAKGHGTLVVRLHNVSCVDGKDYSNVIAAKYASAATGIDFVTVDGNKAMKVYNLNGQRVNHSQKGVCIVNGKKVVLK